jgi:omega-amidase
MKKTARETGAALTGSLIIRENNACYNRMIWATCNGEVNYYDKRHLFRMGNEHLSYLPGNRNLTITIAGWRFRPLICYDLRFPVWSRNQNDYDVLVYIANWPESRREAYITLLKARAIENQAYAVFVNRTGKDGMDISYSGDSMVVDPRGKIISETGMNEEKVETLTLHAGEIVSFREKFQAWQDADKFIITE